MLAVRIISILTIVAPLVATAGGGKPAGGAPGGMANAYTAANSMWSIFHNPAALTNLENTAAGLWIENRFLIRELNLAAAAIAVPAGQGNISGSIHTFGFSLYRENTFSLAYAHELSPGFSGAVKINYFQISFPGDYYGNKNIITADFSLFSKLSDQVTMGAVISNPTNSRVNDYQDERLPGSLTIGIGWNPDKDLLITADVEKDMLHKANTRLGIEYRASEKFFLRTGAAINPGVFAFGMGVILKDFVLDISSNYHQILGHSPQVSLTFSPNQ